MYSEKDFITTIQANQGIIHRVCNVYLQHAQEREDLFQEILLAAWKGISNFKGEAKFSTWLYQVALNTAISFYRKQKRQVQTGSLPEYFNPATPALPVEQDEKIKAMYLAIAALSTIDKALVLLYLDDYSYTDIGDILGITANNVAVKMNRIKVKLKENTQKFL